LEIILEVVFYNQLCFLHFYRNLKGKLTLKSTKQIYTLWKKIKEAESYDEGLSYFNELVEFVRTYNPEYAQQIEMKKENYLAFLKYPEEIRRHIYTTNIVESINSGIELRRLFYNVLHNFREKSPLGTEIPKLPKKQASCLS